MPSYMKGLMLSPDYPDLALVGQTIVHINNVPKDFIENKQVESLKQELRNLAEKAGEPFHIDLATDVHIKKGSIIVDIFFNCELPALLSDENLKRLGVYYIDEPIISGVKAGTTLYFTYRTFKAIKRLDRAMSRIGGTLKGYILIRLSAAKNAIKQDREDLKIGESRRGVLGLLSRLYDAVDVCNSTSAIEKRLDAIKRVRNAINILDVSISLNEDREFLCQLILPLIENIKEEDVSEEANYSEKNKGEFVTNYNKYRNESIENIKKLSGKLNK